MLFATERVSGGIGYIGVKTLGVLSASHSGSYTVGGRYDGPSWNNLLRPDQYRVEYDRPFQFWLILG